MRVTKNAKDTTMIPTKDGDREYCERLMQGSDYAIVKLFCGVDGMFLEFTPIAKEDVE